MNGKHIKKQKPKRKQTKRCKLKIKDKKQFIKMIIAMTILILSFILVMIYDNNTKTEETLNQDIEIEQSIENEQVESQENIDENIDKNQEIKDNDSNSLEGTKVTSRSGNTVRDNIKVVFPEKLEEPEIKYVSAKNGLNVRESYSVESEIVKALAYATKVTITEKYQDWGKIGENQWVNMEYLSDEQPVVKVQTEKQTTTSTTETSGEWIKFTATGYCSCSQCCGKSTGITASGAKAIAGVTVAMSSKYAFGTKIEIKGMGTYICQDRGGAIQGNKIDIYFSSHQEALNFGRRTVYVKILK